MINKCEQSSSGTCWHVLLYAQSSVNLQTVFWIKTKCLVIFSKMVKKQTTFQESIRSVCTHLNGCTSRFCQLTVVQTEMTANKMMLSRFISAVNVINSCKNDCKQMLLNRFI